MPLYLAICIFQAYFSENDLFSEKLLQFMVSIKEQFVTKSGLYWHKYSI